MTSREFCYWLQGCFELSPTQTFDAEQVNKVKAHLNMVFIHEIDPSYPEAQKPALDSAHEDKPASEERPPVLRC